MHAIVHQIALAGSRGLLVSVALISAHARISGNEVADSMARTASPLVFSVPYGIFTKDIMK